MSSFVPLSEAQTRLTEIVEAMIPGEKLFITVNDHPIAELVRTDYLPSSEPLQPGSAVGKILYMADDFDAPLEDFKEYME
jgi:antitoxin (DNA-binding transcriptional repressor) of toxin-antitoxin stability system